MITQLSLMTQLKEEQNWEFKFCLKALSQFLHTAVMAVATVRNDNDTQACLTVTFSILC